MENVIDILCNVVFYIIGCGIGLYVICLLSRLPGLNDSLGKPVIKVHYKK